MTLRTSAALAAALAAFCAAPALAQNAPAASPVPSPSATPLAEIGRTVVTSDRVAEPIGRSSRPTFVVDRPHLDAYGARTLGDALGDVPGANLFPYGAFGAQVDYGLRGTTSAETLVLMNGVPISSASNGITDLGTLPLLGVSRIEVVESGSSTLYGSSATGGVINVITGGRVQPYARIAAGSLGDRDAAAGTSLGGFSVFVERRVATNAYAYPSFHTSLTDATPAGTRANADAMQSAVRLAYDRALGERWRLHAGADADAYHAGVPGSLAFGLTPLARQNQNRGNVAAAFERYGDRDTFTATLSGATQNLAYGDPSIGGEYDTLDRRVGLSFKDARAWGRSDLVAGLDLARENALLTFAGTGAPLAQTQAQSAAYVQFGRDLSAATRITLGVRGEHDAPIASGLIPSIGAITSIGAARLSANYGASFRVPTIIDLYYPGASNPSLKPERLRNADTTLAFPSFGGGVSLGWFGRHGNNLIVLDDNFIPQNTQHASVEGLQFTAATRPLFHVRASASLTDVYRALDTDTGLRLPRTPPVRATLALDRPFDGGRFAYGARALVAGSQGHAPSAIGVPDAYATADAYLRYRFGPASILSVRVRNLGDERYTAVPGYPEPGRTFSLELATR